MKPWRTLQFRCTLYDGYTLYEMCRHILLDMWSSVEKSQLYLTNLKVLLASECRKTSVSVQRSTIQHGTARNGVFAIRNFGEKVLSGSYYWSLAYAVLRRELRSRKQYEE